MTIFISIVSHQNTIEIVHDLKPHQLASANQRVVLLDNKPSDDLKRYALDHQLHYLENDAIQGFGSNHNRVFQYCRKHLGMDLETDWFIILNPDLECDPQSITTFVKDMEKEGTRIGAPNIFKDNAFQEHEESVRRFPYLWELLTSYIFRKNRTGVDRCCLTACEVDWASGACLAFRADTFEALGGFDERYFLYYEDVDICWRARHLLNVKTHYIPGAKMVHRGKRASHTLNNKHLWWHLTSAIRFAWVRTKTALFGSKSLK
ncbi:glycosyltransferase [Marinimicrobium agarilyticum]|uniref:glycosyltransferase n=1 Tax=Marinimicrobium agarilyticum TaxID=306546 RepID=UPI0004171849|nr:glycosyltransferase family 2 protein [Marinimicrobium agarilyticum]